LVDELGRPALRVTRASGAGDDAIKNDAVLPARTSGGGRSEPNTVLARESAGTVLIDGKYFRRRRGWRKGVAGGWRSRGRPCAHEPRSDGRAITSSATCIRPLPAMS